MASSLVEAPDPAESSVWHFRRMRHLRLEKDRLSVKAEARVKQRQILAVANKYGKIFVGKA